MDLPVPKGGITITFTADGVLTVVDNGRAKSDASYKVNPKKDPPEIDLVPPDTKKEPTVLGIYKLEGDTLTLCFDRGGASARPKNFESVAGDTVIVMTLKRAKRD